MIDINVQQQVVEASLMRELVNSPAWACYVTQLRDMIGSVTERVLTGGVMERELLVGQVAGLRAALHLPEFIINRTKGR